MEVLTTYANFTYKSEFENVNSICEIENHPLLNIHAYQTNRNPLTHCIEKYSFLINKRLQIV